MATASPTAAPLTHLTGAGSVSCSAPAGTAAGRASGVPVTNDGTGWDGAPASASTEAADATASGRCFPSGPATTATSAARRRRRRGAITAAAAPSSARGRREAVGAGVKEHRR